MLIALWLRILALTPPLTRKLIDVSFLIIVLSVDLQAYRLGKGPLCQTRSHFHDKSTEPLIATHGKYEYGLGHHLPLTHFSHTRAYSFLL